MPHELEEEMDLFKLADAFRALHPDSKLAQQFILFARGALINAQVLSAAEVERRAAPSNVRDMLLNTCKLSVRTRNCLNSMNISTLGRLVNHTESELLGLKYFSKRELKEVKSVLAGKGLHLRQSPEEPPEQAIPDALPPISADELATAYSKNVYTDLDLSVRSRKALHRLGITTVGELVTHTEAEILGMKNFGQTSLLEIKQRLAELGLSLRTP